MRIYSLFLVILLFIGLTGCAKKADPEKISEANAFIAKGEYEKGLDLLDQMAKMSPKDENLLKERITGHMKFADYLRDESPLPPKEKYPASLAQYRIVYQLDTSNAAAKNNIGLIEGIYKQMGRTVPN